MPSDWREEGTHKKRNLTCFNDLATMFNVQIRCDEGDVGKVQNLRPMRKGHCPQLWRRAQKVNKTFSISRANFRAVGDSNEIGVFVVTEPVIDVVAWSNHNWLDDVSCLNCR